MIEKMTIKLEVDVDDVIIQILEKSEELQQVVKHFSAIPILIQGINEHCPEPHRSEILAQWDKARTIKGGTHE